MMVDKDKLEQALTNAGWNANVAEALVGHFEDCNFTAEEIVKRCEFLSYKTAFNIYLTWNGIIGYSRSIEDALDNCRNMENGL